MAFLGALLDVEVCSALFAFECAPIAEFIGGGGRVPRARWIRSAHGGTEGQPRLHRPTDPGKCVVIVTVALIMHVPARSLLHACFRSQKMKSGI